ncbi:MAG TPA: HIT domain-containing protein [Actinophytocola sp.]|jgi:diadenosine tetraphosphate (Ap4A) HIT family hydrolase|uniref:HIT family protein n=1 Tax=Actinophytocola sp. TaxID=1872138 RepID=UPI002F9273D2
MASCFICDKQSDPGFDPVGGDELAVVSHVLPGAPGRGPGPVYLGHLVIEPRRHAPGLADITDAEGAAIGTWAARVSRALRAAGAEHVYSMVAGHQVDHLHQHLIPRYPGTPREYWWPPRMDEWSGAKLGGVDEITQVVRGLRAHLQADGR